MPSRPVRQATRPFSDAVCALLTFAMLLANTESAVAQVASPTSTSTSAPTTIVAATPTVTTTPTPMTTGVPATATTPVPARPASVEQGDDGENIQNVERREDEGGGANLVNVENRTDAAFKMRGRVDLVHIDGSNASPLNRASAFASCTDCQTFAVALQIALIRRDARTIAPENVAVAVNYQCTRCYTSARALQYVIQTDDPDNVPDRVDQLVQTMNRELRAISRSNGMTPTQANSRIDVVVSQFVDLATSLSDERQDTDQSDS